MDKEQKDNESTMTSYSALDGSLVYMQGRYYNLNGPAYDLPIRLY